MTQIDLHVHSSYSDGLLSPGALCGLALQKRIAVIALCDHDTTDGLAPMTDLVEKLNQKEERLTFLPSVELSTGTEGRIHVLGYGVDAASPPLQREMAELRRSRAVRGQKMVELLAGLGIHIPAELLPRENDEGMPIGRPHIARAMMTLGVVNTMEQAFDRYLGEGKPAYVPLRHLSAAEAIALLASANAVPVLAHPMRIGLPAQLLEAMVESLIPAGLKGMEVFHPSASHGDVRVLEAIARRHGLLVTGGSDFHGDRGSRAKLGGLPAGWRLWREDVAALSDAICAAHAKQSPSPSMDGSDGQAANNAIFQ